MNQTFIKSDSRSWLLLTVICAAMVAALAFFTLPAAAAPAPSDSTSSNVAAFAGMPQFFEANLAGANQVPAVDSMASGRAVLALSTDMMTLYYRVMVNDISNITVAHIHLGAVGENGSSVFTLYDGTGDFDPDNPSSGNVTLDAAQQADLLAGNYYINVHTMANGSGEIRGQIEAYTPPSSFNALLMGAQEVPVVDTDAIGVARFALMTDTLEYEIEVSDIMSITAAHIHLGAMGEEGSSVFTLFDGTGDFAPDDPISGTAMLTAENVVDLLTDHYYVNVHTTDNPPGEIRGQIGGARTFQSALSGANEVPAVDTAASGNAVLALSADTTMLYYRVMVSNIMSITVAHIHLGAMGEEGSSVFTLYDGTGDFDPDNPISGNVELSSDNLLDLLADNYYINVHTTDNQQGEIRGQIASYTPPNSFTVMLSGANEVPAVDTSANGTSNLSLNSNTPMLHYNVSVSDIMSVRAAHIHAAPAGMTGSSVFTLYNGMGSFDADNPVGGAVSLSAENLVDLLTDYYYVNVHTTTNPSGEIRGQISASQAPTAVTMDILSAHSTPGTLPLALLSLAFTSLTGALFVWRRRR